MKITQSKNCKYSSDKYDNFNTTRLRSEHNQNDLYWTPLCFAQQREPLPRRWNIHRSQEAHGKFDEAIKRSSRAEVADDPSYILQHLVHHVTVSSKLALLINHRGCTLPLHRLCVRRASQDPPTVYAQKYYSSYFTLFFNKNHVFSQASAGTRWYQARFFFCK